MTLCGLRVGSVFHHTRNGALERDRETQNFVATVIVPVGCRDGRPFFPLLVPRQSRPISGASRRERARLSSG